MRAQTRYALLLSDYEYPTCLRLPFEKVSVLTVGLPLFAFLFCIVYSVLFDFESSTFTHCQVSNVLPSISAAIGNFSPQREVWQSAILLHAAPRFCIAFMYLRHNQSFLYPRDYWMSVLACIFNVTENIALLILSFFTSSENYGKWFFFLVTCWIKNAYFAAVHEKAFVTFILMSEFYMIVTCVLQSRFKKQNRKSLKYKKVLLTMNISCILIATYCFGRHNSYCEPYGKYKILNF